MGSGRGGCVQVGEVFRWGGCSGGGGGCSGGGGAQWGEGNKRANVRGFEREQRGERWREGGGESSTDSFCNLILGFGMD